VLEDDSLAAKDLQVTEDELGNVNLLLRVDLDWNTSTVVEDRDHIVLLVNRHFEAVHGGVIDLQSEAMFVLGTPNVLSPSESRILTLLSAALTRISSKILKKPGT